MYSICPVQVVSLKALTAKILIMSGPRKGLEITIPRTVVQDSECLAVGDDELSILSEFASKEQIAGV